MQNNFISFPSSVFVTGTDTNIGKSVICAILMAGLKGIYWKPVQSGLEEISDTEWVKEKTGLPDRHFRAETYRLTKPLSPHASSLYDGIRIDLESFQLPEITGSDHFIIEGAGGILVPLNEKEYMVDLMEKLLSPVILVSSASLGTINHTLLSLEYLKGRGIDIMGVVMNGPKNRINREAIEHYGRVSVLAEVDPLSEINPESLRQCFIKYFGDNNG